MVRKVDRAESFVQEQLVDLGDAWLTTMTDDSGQNSLMMWKSAGAVDIEIETTLHELLIADLYGNAFRLFPDHKGMVYLTLTQSPFYINCTRAELKRVAVASFQLAAHNETVVAGQNTSGLRLGGALPDSCTGVVQVGFLTANSSTGTLATGMDVTVPANVIVLDEVYEAVLWLMNTPTASLMQPKEQHAAGRLASSIRVVHAQQ